MPRRSDRFPTETFLQLLNHFRPSTIRYSRRVFVNRNLRLRKIQAVGFDMDYTLAIYKPAFEQLAWDMALKRLVTDFQFPEKILAFRYDRDFAIRGLVIDMMHGNILKMDRHRHVSRAFHGTRSIPEGDRKERYRQKRLQLSRPEYFLVDTLFSLPETHMYAQMVDMLDKEGRGNARTYNHAYQSIRQAVDGIHRDGTLKALVVKDMATYIEKDADIAYTLERFIYSGKKLFLATNSGWSYTDAVMSFLLDGVLDSFPRWTDYFEHIVVEAAKPGFFAGKGPMTPEPLSPTDIQHKVFRGGNLRAFEGLLNCFGDKILYIGDHIYGDILRSKKHSAWRTAMVIPEIEPELAGLEATRELQTAWDGLFQRRLLHEIEANYQQRLLMSLLNLDELARVNGNSGVHPISQVVEVSERNITQIRQVIERFEAEMAENETHILKEFNPRWGMLVKEETAHSVFGEQIQTWACVYTSRLSNFLSYSPFHYFRAPRDLLPHEREV